MDIYTTLVEMLLKRTKKEEVRTGLKMAMELYEQSGHLSYNDLYDKELLEEAIDGCLAMDESDSKMTKRYRLKISYSWGDEEENEKSFDDFEDAWTIARNMALKEMETASSEYGDDNGNYEIGLTFDKTRRRIDLHYTHDDSHCYYDMLQKDRSIQIIRVLTWNLSLMVIQKHLVLIQELLSKSQKAKN